MKEINSLTDLMEQYPNLFLQAINLGVTLAKEGNTHFTTVEQINRACSYDYEEQQKLARMMEEDARDEYNAERDDS